MNLIAYLVIGIGKKAVKQRRLEMILTNQEENMWEIIRESFEGIDPQQVACCVARSLGVQK